MSGAEFSRTRRLDTIGAGEIGVEIAAAEDERRAVAARFGLLALDRLAAEFRLRRDGAGVAARGNLSASGAQACVVTGDPVAFAIDAPFELRFEPEGNDLAEEVELSDSDCDTIFFEGGTIDLGEAAAETLALMLDPYPRSPEAETAAREAGIKTEEEAGPFAALSALKDRLGRD